MDLFAAFLAIVVLRPMLAAHVVGNEAHYRQQQQHQQPVIDHAMPGLSAAGRAA